MDFAQAAAMFLRMGAAAAHGPRAALEKAGALAEAKAKAAIGTYEYGWPSLAPSTVSRKGADTPLLQTGELRDSIGHTLVSDHECEVGSNDPKAEWHELGTSKMPPRSFIAETGRRHEGEIVALLEKGLVGPLSLKVD